MREMSRLYMVRFFVTSVLFAMLLCLSAANGPKCNAQEPGKMLPKQIQTAAELKTEAEAWASALKRVYGEKKMKKGKRVVSEENYMQANAFYIDAQKAQSGWLNRLEWEMRSGKDIRQSSEYDEIMQTAAVKAEKFIGYTKGILLPGTRGGAMIVGDLLKVLKDFGVEMWKEYRSGKEKQRKSLVDHLESLKWREFDKI